MAPASIACWTSRAGSKTSWIGLKCLACRRPPAPAESTSTFRFPEDDLRIGPAPLSSRRDAGRGEAPENRDDRAHGEEAPAGHGLRRLPPEHPGQDARDGLFGARERLCRRFDAARLARGEERPRSARRHDPHRAEAVSVRRRQVGAPAKDQARPYAGGLAARWKGHA